MTMEGVTSPRARPTGVRTIDRLTRADVESLGDEALDLAILQKRGVPVARGWVVPLGVDLELLADFLGERFGESRPGSTTSVGRDQDARACLLVRSWFRRSANGARPRARFPASIQIEDPGEIAARLGAVIAEAEPAKGSRGALWLRVLEIQDALSGEPGAYTARVRLRREEDARWRSFEPPTRLPPRHRDDE